MEVGVEVSLPWRVRQTTARTAALFWDTYAPIGQEAALLWTLRALTAQSPDLRWNIRVPAWRERTFLWHVLRRAHGPGRVVLGSGGRNGLAVRERN